MIIDCEPKINIGNTVCQDYSIVLHQYVVVAYLFFCHQTATDCSDWMVPAHFALQLGILRLKNVKQKM